MSTSDDKELDLTGGEELSLSDHGEDLPTLPVDEGLDLDSDEGLTLDASSSEDVLVGIDDNDGPPPVDDTLTGLKLGDDLGGLDNEVLAKMKEIDEIMEYDATHAGMTVPEELQDDEDGELKDLFATTSTTEELVDEDSAPLEALTDGDDDLGLSFETGDADESSPLELGADLGFDPGEQLAPSEEEASDAGFAMAEAEIEPEIEATFDPANAVPPPGVAKAPTAIQAVAPETREEPAPRAASTPVSGHSGGSHSEYKEVVGHYNAELERLQATLNHLRSDRESLLKKLDEFEEDKIHHQRHLLNLRAELDEKKIETQLMKKRMGEETQDLRYSLQLEQERRHIAEEKLKAQQAEMAAVQQKIRMEVRKATGHERELEQQLELLKSDAETQIRNRDLKILELKRRLDAMEFDVENMSVIEKKTQENKQELEVKLDKAIRTLRAAIGILEVDDPKVASLEKLKKNLDV